MNVPTRRALHVCATTSSSKDLCTECAARVSQLLDQPLVSPLHHLLSDTKRHIPSAEEEVQVRAVIQDAEQRITEIDAASARINRLLEDLAKERVKIQDYTDLHKVMVAPVWNLPPEILSSIFMACIPRRLRYSHDITRASIRPSLLLAGVNQHWRDVALSTPHLWTVMHIDEQCFAEDEPICMPKIFLNRSGDLPLSLFVRAKEYPCCASLTALVSSLSRRWQRITLDIEVGNLAALFNPNLTDPLPALQHLDLRISPLWLDGVEVNPFTYFTEAPALAHISTTNQFSTNFRVLPQWGHLKTWDSPVPLADFPLIFEWAPNLEHCFLQPTRLAFGQTLPPPDAMCSSAVHNHLTSLHISTGLITNVTVQLHHLPHFPALRRLFIYLDKHVLLPSPDNTLVPLFARSGALLEHLTLALNVSHATLRECLAHTPAVTSLQIHRIATDAMLGFLSEKPSARSSYLLPKLVTLRLSGKTYFTAQAVINIINARWTDPAADPEEGHGSGGGEEGVDATKIPTVPCYPRSLKSVYILPPRHDKFDLRTRKELLSFKDKGFDVQITQFDRVEFIRHVV